MIYLVWSLLSSFKINNRTYNQYHNIICKICLSPRNLSILFYHHQSLLSTIAPIKAKLSSCNNRKRSLSSIIHWNDNLLIILPSCAFGSSVFRARLSCTVRGFRCAQVCVLFLGEFIVLVPYF